MLNYIYINMNNYIISIDLNKLYNDTTKTNSTKTNSTFDKVYESNIPRSKEEKFLDVKLANLMDEYNSVDIFNWNIDSSHYLSDIIYKYNIDITDNNNLVLNDKIKLVNSFYKNPQKILSFNKGVIVFDNGMILDNELREILNLVFANNKEMIMNKIYNEYVIYFNLISNQLAKQVETNSKINFNQFNEKLNTIFIDDIDNQLLFGKIKNIPNIIRNEKFNKKIFPELKYFENIQKNIYNNYYKGIKHNNEWSNYEQLLYSENLINSSKNNSSICSIDYRINLNDDQTFTIPNKTKALNILHEYNNNLNLIQQHMQTNQFDQFDHLDQINVSNKLLKIILLDDLFNVHKLTDLFNFIIQKKTLNSTTFHLKMDKVLDDNVYIYENLNYENNDLFDGTKNNNSNNFSDNIIMFINKLLKRKIQKIIRQYNYSQNKIYIDNNN